MIDAELARQKLAERELLRIIGNMSEEDQRITAMALKTHIIKNEICRREVKALNLVDDVTDVIRSYLNKPADLDNSEALIRELRQVLKVKED